MAEPGRAASLHSLRVGFLLILGVLLYGTVGYAAAGWNWGDAFFQVVITISGVGFGEVRPLAGPWLRLHTILVIGLGLVATGWTVAGILRYVTEQEIDRALGHRRVRKQIDGLRDHTIVVGSGRMGTLLGTELHLAGAPFVVIEKGPDRLADLQARGCLWVEGDATVEKVLLEAGLDRAKALVTTIPSDAANVFITLTARQMSTRVHIVARAEEPTTERKLLQAGANHVILPAAIGAHRIAAMLLNPRAVEFSELVTRTNNLQIEIEEAPVDRAGPFDGRTLRDLDVGRRTGVMVMAIKRADGRVEFPPTGGEALAPGDSIILLGRRPNLDDFRMQFC